MFDQLFTQYGSLFSILAGVLVGFIVYKKTSGSWAWSIGSAAAVTFIVELVRKKQANKTN